MRRLLHRYLELRALQCRLTGADAASLQVLNPPKLEYLATIGENGWPFGITNAANI